MVLEINDRRTHIQVGPFCFLSLNAGLYFWGHTILWFKLLGLEAELTLCGFPDRRTHS